MYYDFTVPMPKVPGKITLMKKGKLTYVQLEIGREYFPERRYTIPKRVSIGKLSPDNPEMMYPNEKYQDYFPDAVMPEERPEAYRSCALRIGAYAAIRKVLEEYKLPEMLEKQLGNDCGLFLDLVSFMIVDEENVAMHYPDFAFCHPLFSEGMRIYSDVKISRLLNSISKDQIIGYLNDWNKKRDKKQRIYISYDSTNKNCQAGDVDLVEFGKAKDEKGLPIFNIAVAFDKTNRVPLLYEEYPGSINDTSQLPFMVDKVKAYGYEKLGFILDRGYFSKDNIQYMESNGYAFIIMVKGKKDLVSSLVLKNRNTFETSRPHAIRSYRVYGKTVTSRLYEDDTKDRYFHIYYDPGRMSGQRELLEQQIEKYRTFLEKHVGTDQKFSKLYHNYFELTYIVRGSCSFHFEGERIVLREGNICITSNLAWHEAAPRPDCLAVAIVARKSTFDSLFAGLLSRQDLVSLFFRKCLRDQGHPNYVLLHTGKDPALFRTMHELVYESNLTDDYSNECCVNLLNLFLARALRASAANVTLRSYDGYSQQSLDFSMILHYIQQNYRTATLSSLADAFHFSEAYLSKLIQRNMGQSFTEVLRQLKMERAEELLRNTELKIVEISQSVGYESVDHFTRTFRKVYGIPPREYRAIHQTNKREDSENEAN